jgi:hypothetical protein
VIADANLTIIPDRHNSAGPDPVRVSSATRTTNVGKTTRKSLHAYLSDSAFERWHKFAADQGVTLSATLEAFAPELDLSGPEISEPFQSRLTAVVNKARQIDTERRQRNRR